ncbi:MAG TPA: DNA-primase RepB domain-containing protein, partial [Rhodanobacteraceae bacterium]|nr:DNA-primase RepB domain-containing protein [Rhodanobacteraceae bacterium]
RAYFADFDTVQPPEVATVPLPPHCVIESSCGRWHWYWWIDGAPLDTFADVQRAIAARFGSDPKVNDLPRVMRLPGFLHRKGTPFRTRIVELRGDLPRYTHAEFVRTFAIDVNTTTVSKTEENRKGATVTPLPTAKRTRRTLPDVIPEGERNATLLSAAAGFVRKGYNPQAVTDRLRRINVERCQPPLDALEVNAIVARAVAYGSEGFIQLPHALLDSPEWKALAPAAHDIIILAFRRFDGFNNGDIALTFADFAGRDGFAKPDTFREHRNAAVLSGILIQACPPRNTQCGRKPSLYAIASHWIPDVFARPKKRVLRQTQKGNTYIDKQFLGDSRSGRGSGCNPKSKKDQAA